MQTLLLNSAAQKNHAQLLIHRARMCILQLDSMYFHLLNNPFHMKDLKCFSRHRLSLKRFRKYKLTVSTLHAWLSPRNAKQKNFSRDHSLYIKSLCKVNPFGGPFTSVNPHIMSLIVGYHFTHPWQNSKIKSKSVNPHPPTMIKVYWVNMW